MGIPIQWDTKLERVRNSLNDTTGYTDLCLSLYSASLLILKSL